MSAIPWRCVNCGASNMIDVLGLEVMPVDRVVSVRGFKCEKCGAWNEVGYESQSLQEAERKLERYSPTQKKYGFLLKKLIHKARSLAEKIHYTKRI